MKKVLSLLLVILTVSSLFTGVAYAEASNFITASLGVDVNQHLVTVTGNAPAGPQSQVSILVTSPSEKIEYIGQKTCGAAGSFEFAFNLKQPSEDGYYTAEIGGVSVSTPKSIMFTASGQLIDEQYTVSFDVNGGSAVLGQTISSNVKASQPAAPTKEGYTFAGWYTSSSFTTEFDFANTTITSNTTIYAKWNLIQPTPTPTPTPTPITDKIEVVPVIKGETAQAEIDADTLNKAFQAATKDAQGNKEVTIEIKAAEGVKEYILEMPKEAFTVSKPGEKDANNKIEIKTPVGTVTILESMFKAKDIQNASNVRVSIAVADTSKLKDEIKEKIGNKPVIELKALVDGKLIDWKNNNAPVTVSINYTPTANELKNSEHIVVWYIDGKGKLNKVPSGKYNTETGKVTFTTTHFSQYAVAYEVNTFDDIKNIKWAKKQIEVLVSKGVISGTSDKTFAPK